MATATVVDGELAQVMDQMPYGVYIIGSKGDDGDLNGMMADWVMQVSFRPRLIAVSFENDAHTLANIRDNGWFSVNMLPANEDGRHVAAGFLQPYEGAKIRGRTAEEQRVIHHKMDRAAHAMTTHGTPVLGTAMAWVECEARDFVAAGDHTMVIGEVVDGKLLTAGDVLSSVYTGWVYSG